MSATYDLYCLDCGAEAGFAYHGTNSLMRLWSHAKAWAQFEEMRAVLGIADDSNFELEPKLWGDENSALGKFPAFAKVHLGHRVTLKDEYGKISGECNERVQCTHCGTWKLCRLPDGHVGEHQGKHGV